MVRFVKETVIINFVCVTKEDLTKRFKDKAFRN